MIKVQYLRWRCIVKVRRYRHARRKAILLLRDDAERRVIAVATVNVPTEHLSNNEVIVKSVEENRGILQVLSAAGVVSDPLRWIQAGGYTMPVCRLLIGPQGPARAPRRGTPDQAPFRSARP